MAIELRDIDADQVDALQELIESDPGYVERVTGYPPGPSDALSLLMMRPPGVPEAAKRVLGAWTDGELVGVVDLVRGYPSAEFVHIGLLQVRGDRQGRALGTRIHALMLDEISSWAPEATALRAAIVATNAEHAEPFWRARGYEPVGDAKPYAYDKLETTVRIWRRPV